MKFILKINGTESKKTEYIGWTPVKCTLTIDSFDGAFPLLVKIRTGHIDGEGRISLYESNSTSATAVDEISHNFQNEAEFNFFVAGKYPHASIAIKDTSILVTSEIKVIEDLEKKIMVRVRKNAEDMEPKEIEKFLAAFVKLNNLPSRNSYIGQGFTAKPSKLLHEIILMHTYDAMREIHGRTSFHPWHRAFLSHLERELQEVDGTVTVPYWRFDQPAPKLFTDIFIGQTPANSSSPGPVKPTFKTTNPLYTYQTVWGDLTRGYQNQDPANEKSRSIADQSTLLQDRIVENVYGILGDNVSSTEFKGWAFLEETRSHNRSHGVFTGLVADIGKDPVDPLFFMLHGNVDRLWALWQRKYKRINATESQTYPYQGAYNGLRGGQFRFPNNDDIGNFALDTLWPWDLDHEATRPGRRWNFQHPIGSGSVPQINLTFPDSPVGVAPGTSPTVESTVDYQGRLDNGNSWGFDYDHIPYFDHDVVYYEDESMEDINQHNAVFFDYNRPIEERLKAAKKAFMRNSEEYDLALEILKNENENLRIRLESLDHINDAEEQFLDVAIELIANDSVDFELRSQLIHSVYMAKRSNKHYPSRQPIFFDILRGLITNENEQLRSVAIEVLSANEDNIVQEFLVTELQKEESAFLTKENAIAFLTQTLKPEHSKLFMKIFAESDNDDVKSSALRGLANDPNSAEFLKKVLLDKTISFKLREASALAFHHMDHVSMNNLAAEIIAKPENGTGIKIFTSNQPNPDEVDFKSGLLNMLAFTAEVSQIKQGSELKSTLEELIDPKTTNKINFISTVESFNKSTVDDSGQTDIEKLARKLLDKLKEENDD
ncbi:tyrosinase family protein [uncultured Psychroserpens sp.]|uniref:tyrosinase family protein n=1 Tax=uncultured Psychroserpens sp. TaxID=255436 RepID=UPI002629E530|nr:tyrosinase family protein [uncultured Psychroserpens sp.]